MDRIGNYNIIRKIAEGGMAHIYQAEHVYLNELACLKQCKTSDPNQLPDLVELLREEAKILWKLYEHHSIPSAKDFFPTGDGNYVMVMNYIDGKTLEGLVKDNSRIHPEDVCWITERLLGALWYVHCNGVVHSDVKPGNVIIEPKKHDIKLIDFGLSTYRPTSTTRPMGYTEAYVAPEILQGKPPIPETDLYGAGLVMLYALGGNPLTKTFPTDVPRQLTEYCGELLRYDPMERPNWDTGRLMERLSDIRSELFGRRHMT